jgi:CheY-like chemotaxis protein
MREQAEDGGTTAAALLIVEDHPLTRDGLRQLFESQPGLVVCGEAGTLAEARRLGAERRPDLILLDLGLPDGNGLSLLEESRTWARPPKVLVFSASDDGSDEAAEAMMLGGERVPCQADGWGRGAGGGAFGPGRAGLPAGRDCGEADSAEPAVAKPVRGNWRLGVSGTG